MTKTLKELAFSEIRDFVHEHASVFSTEDLASKVLGELKEKDRYEAVVTSQGKFGLVTVRNLLDIDQPSQTKVERVWKVTGTLSPRMRVLEAADWMIRNNIRAIPVVENKEIVGCISQVELINALCEVDELSEVPVKGLMRQPVVSIDINERTALARRIMLEKGISHIPVVEYNRLVGIVTAESIVHTFITPIVRTTRGEVVGEKVDRFPGTVGGIMDVHPFTVGPDASILDVIKGLRDYKKSACVVADEKKAIVSIVTPRELMAPLLSLKQEEELPVYVMGLSEEDFFERSVAEEKVRRVVRRSMRMHPHIQQVSIKIDRSRVQGNRPRYEMTARVLSPEEQFIAEATGWDLLAVFDALCDRLDRVLAGSKHGPEQVRARRTKPG